MTENYGDELNMDRFKTSMRLAFKSGVAHGTFEQNKQSFKLSHEAKKALKKMLAAKEKTTAAKKKQKKTKSKGITKKKKKSNKRKVNRKTKGRK